YPHWFNHYTFAGHGGSTAPEAFAGARGRLLYQPAAPRPRTRNLSMPESPRAATPSSAAAKLHRIRSSRAFDEIATQIREELTEARIWLESVVVRQACRRATKADIDALNRNIEETRAAADAGNFALRAEKNVEFHRILARMTRNPIMVIVMNGVLDVLRHFIS